MLNNTSAFDALLLCYFVLHAAAATETGAKFVELRASEVVRGAVGESEKAVERAFKAARELAPAIIFIDEFQVRAEKRLAIVLDYGHAVVLRSAECMMPVGHTLSFAVTQLQHADLTSGACLLD
jgi:hypothetical protein